MKPEEMIKAGKNPDMIIQVTKGVKLKVKDVIWNWCSYEYRKLPEHKVNWQKVIDEKVPCILGNGIELGYLKTYDGQNYHHQFLFGNVWCSYCKIHPLVANQEQYYLEDK